MSRYYTVALAALSVFACSSCHKTANDSGYYSKMAKSRHWVGYVFSSSPANHTTPVDTTLAVSLGASGQTVAIWGDTLNRLSDNDTTVYYSGTYSMFNYYKRNDSMAYTYFRATANSTSDYKLIHTD